MKKYILSAVAVLSAGMFTSCNDMLDTDPRPTEMTQATFPGKPADVEALNAATYSIMNTMGGGDSDNQNIFFWWEVMSDNCFGSGGLQDNKVKSLHHLVEMNVNQYEAPFTLLYGGISRANNTIETIDNVPWTDAQKAQRNQLLGEAFFMRGLYTLWLTQLFGEVKDNIIMSSVNSGHRTLDEWHTFVRREHEAGNDIRLGILEVMEEQEKPTQESSTDIGHAQQLSDAQVAEVSPQPVIPEELRTEKAAKMFRKAISKGLCDECYHWKHSKVLLAYFADRASEYLQLSKAEQDGKKKVFWKPFETLFQVSGLSGARNTYTNKTGILPQNHKIVDAIFD